MKTRISLLTLVLGCIGVSPFVFAELRNSTRQEPPPPTLSQQFIERTFSPVVDEDRRGLLSTEEWRRSIDEAWGEGVPTAEKLRVFDKFWETIDEKFACFQDLDVDWEALRQRYRPEVEQGVSRGRFAAILNHLSLALRESHTVAEDKLVNWYTRMVPGVPLLSYGGWGDHSRFGAALTPLPDESLLVYKSLPDHPLGLEPGDIVLGYEGQPWKEIFPALLAAELPITGGWWGSCPSAYQHSWLISAGLNWHLFKTIDVLKHDTKRVVTLSTSLLKQLGNRYIDGFEQMTIPGVPMYSRLQQRGGEVVSWGVVEGTDIGYIYVWAWSGDAEEAFYEAVRALMFDYETSGLIIDFRTNYGGNMFLSFKALELLYDEEVWTVSFVERHSIHDHLSFRQSPTGFPQTYVIHGDPNTFYDKPIAVLTGPGALSSGDQVALRMAFHPRVRLFGKPTAAAFNAPKGEELGPYWSFRFAEADARLVTDPGRNLTHDELRVDEEVWLTPDDVAQGRDTVVEAAKAWIHGETLTDELWFPHFGTDTGSLSSRLLLYNPNREIEAWSQISLSDDDGGPIGLDLNGRHVEGRTYTKIPASGLQILSTGRAGPFRTGSIAVRSDSTLNGVVFFERAATTLASGQIVMGGVAGVGASLALRDGFLLPIENRISEDISTGVAIRNLSDNDVQLELSLLSSSGGQLSTTQRSLPPAGHLSLYFHELSWSPETDLSDFVGVLKVESSAEITGVALRTYPNELVTLPVVPLGSSSQETGDQLHELYFPQFADGIAGSTLLASQIILVNPDTQRVATAEVVLRDDFGNLLSVDLNGQVVQGTVSVQVQPQGLRILESDGRGPLQVGSVLVTSDSPLGGVTVFAGSVGAAGVGNSQEVHGSLIAPVESNALQGINTGIAFMNLEERSVSLQMELADSDGRVLATAELAGGKALKGRGHLAVFVNEFAWAEQVDFSDFKGLLRVIPSGQIAAVALHTRPNQFATVPVTVQ